ncbi:hypothetical protein HA402_011406 [Bradysia odoriphaga]|nr:hypothetical protein HA402_011406 [Bradysia odoriphaga]
MLKMLKISLLIVFIAANSVSADEVSKDIIKSGNRCTLLNRKYGEFIYPIDGLDYDDARRNVATWIPGWSDDQCYWQLAKSSTNNYYKIKNLKFGEYFYSLDDTGKPHKVGDTRAVLTWKPKTACENQCYWELSLVDVEKSKYFLIRNTDFDEYLFASENTFDSDRRKVYTRQNHYSLDVHIDEAAQWAVHCEDDAK